MIEATRWRADFSDPAFGVPPRPATADANLYGSPVTAAKLGDDTMHRPVLDIDLPARLVPSSTPGHYHLYLDLELPWPVYRWLLEALAHVGIIEPGFCEASIRRGGSFCRLPTVRKEESDADSGDTQVMEAA